MMKLNSKLNKILLGSLLVGSFGLFSSDVLAQGMRRAQKDEGTQNNGSRMMGNNNENFCSTLDTMESKILDQVVERETERTSKRTDRKNTIAVNRTERTDALVENRTEWEARRQEIFTKLLEKAQTDEQKAAVLALSLIHI